jgi:RHS repeat-associated protein
MTTGVTNTVTDPLGNDTVHVFKAQIPSAGANCNFYETTTQIYQGAQSSGKLLKQVDTQYSSASLSIDDTAFGAGVGNVVPTSITTTIYPSGKVSRVTKQYDAGLGANAPIFGNVVTEKVYDWGQDSPGALLRETDTTYAWQVNSAYLTAHMVNLLASVVVKDGTGCALSQTDYTYDETAYLTGYETTVGTLPTGTHVAAPATVRGDLTTVTKWLNPTSSCNPKGGTAIKSHTNWYDTGEAYQQIDALGRMTTHSYDLAYAGAYPTQTCLPTTNGVAHCVSATYDFTTGVITSFTNENATTYASGNTPGDSAHTSNYSYDPMFRPTSGQAPPDPTNNGARAQTTLSYSLPNVFPVAFQHTKTVTNSLSDSATTSLDGLGRPYNTQHVMTGGPAIVDTTYDQLGHVGDVSNPYFSTSDTTYGSTHTDYDALDRPIKVTQQDQSVSTVAYSVTPIQAAPGDCSITTDEAGKQRMGCSDALGRLIEVHEPNPTAQATPANVSVVISGSLLYQNGVGAYGGSQAKGNLTIAGTEGAVTTCNPDIQPTRTNPCPGKVTTYDHGHVDMTVGGRSYTVLYNASSNDGNVATGLANAITNDGGAVVSASAINGVLYLTAVQANAAGNSISWTLSSTSTDTTGNFGPDGSFGASPSGGSLSGGSDAFPGITIYDRGTVTLTTSNGASATACYGQSTDCAAPPTGCPTGNSTASQVACVLAAGLNASSSVSAIYSGATITVADKTPGRVGNGVSITGSSQSTQTQWTFSPPSFCAPPGCNATLGNGLNAGDVDNSPYITQYQYDALGNLVRVDQKGSASNDTTQWRTRLFSYDSLSRLLTADNPESGTIAYSYDAVGNLLQKTSPAPNQTGSPTQTVSYCYDELDRVTARDYTAHTYSPPACPIIAPVVSYAYDQGANAKGRLTSLTDQAGSAGFTYDILGRMSGESRTTNGVTKNMAYAYHLGGSLKTITYPSGAVVTYTPDSASRDLSAVDNGNGISYVTSATYDATSALTGFVSGYTGSFAGITSSFTFNKRLQPVVMSAASPTQTVFSIGYDFQVGNGTSGSGSDNGNVYALTNNKDNTRSQAFAYDALNRLTSAQNAGTDCTQTLGGGQTKFWGNSYSYDAWGNLLSKSVTKCSAEALSLTALANNQLSGYGYDAAGNMTADNTDGVTAQYDPENRIASATKNGLTTTYSYDADGNRVEKATTATPPTGTLYWYMSPGIVAESDLAGNLQSEYVFFDGERVARKDFPSNAVSYYFSDHLKTTDIVTDSQGNIKNESDFYPYGGELPFVANDSNHYKFTGKERDSETNLDYFGARYYSNGLGRFITPDWSGVPVPVPYADLYDPQSLNQYTYVRNIPTVNVDTAGHQCAGTCTAPTYDPEVVKQILATVATGGGSALAAAAPAIVLALPSAGATTFVATQPPMQNTPDGSSNLILDALNPSYQPAPPVPQTATGGNGAKDGENNTTTAVSPGPEGMKNGSSKPDGAGKPFNETTKNGARTESGDKCVFCGKNTTREPGPDQSNIDHADARSNGGDNSPENAQNTCRTCNQDKGTRSTEEYLKHRQDNPQKYNHEPH